MPQARTVYDHIATNNIKTGILVLMFPIMLCFIIGLLTFLFFMDNPHELEAALSEFKTLIPILFAIALGWMGISYFTGDKMMLTFAKAKQLTPSDKEYTRVYKSVENIALAAGLPMPHVYLIEDKALNAFATGHAPSSASIALTRGIIETLKPLELEGVIAHEMAHIGNRDIRLNMLIITGLNVFALLADIFLRIRPGYRSNKKSQQLSLIFMIIGLSLLIFNFLIAPLLYFAVSRMREYAADATGALITRHPEALADALSKISTNAHIKTADTTPQMASAYICCPLKNQARSFLGFGETHPPITERIRRLRQMIGYTL